MKKRAWGRGKPKQIDEEHLISLYRDCLHTLNECAKELGIHPSTCTRHLRANDITIRPRGPSNDIWFDEPLKKELQRLRGRGITVLECAYRLGMGYQKTLRQCKELKLSSRRNSGSIPGEESMPDYKIIACLLAESWAKTGDWEITAQNVIEAIIRPKR